MALIRELAIQMAQMLLVLLVAPALVGLVRKVKARLLRRRGAPILQPYRDLRRLLRKDVVLAENASWLFRVTPYLIFAATWVAAALVPTFGTGLLFSWSADLIAIIALLASARFFLALAGMDVGTSFGGIGSSRDVMIASLAEAAMVFEKPDWLAIARRAFDFVVTCLGAEDGRLHHSFRAGKARNQGLIDDYAQMARAADIAMTDTYLLHERQFAHFMTKRFDRVGADRLHMHSLGGIHHVDFNVRGALSYEEYLRTVRLLGMGQPAVNQAFRRMVFNVAAVNQDDHVKNVAFLMTPDGRWQLSPAYDVTYAKGNQWTRTHQMTVNGKDTSITRVDLMKVGAMMDVPRDGTDIIAEVDAALALWEPEARAVDVPSEWITRIAGDFQRLV